MNAVKPVLPPAVVTAIEEQQTRVWRLRSLLDVFREAVIDGDNIDDKEAALDALIELADEVYKALDTESIASRAAEFEDEKRREAEREKQRTEVFGSDDGSQPTTLKLMQ